jgi:hypothetical protein
MHEFHRFSPAPLCKDDGSHPVVLSEVEGQLCANPLFRAVNALPLDAPTGNQFHNSHITETSVPEPELIDSPDDRRPRNILCPPTGQPSLLRERLEHFVGKRVDSPPDVIYPALTTPRAPLFLPVRPRILAFHIVLEAVPQLAPGRIAGSTELADGLPTALRGTQYRPAS